VIGQLTFLNNAVSGSNRNREPARDDFPTKGHKFWPGRFVNIRLVLNNDSSGGARAREPAPQMSANGSFVYVVKQDSTAEQRPVSLGQRQGDLIVVENGVGCRRARGHCGADWCDTRRQSACPATGEFADSRHQTSGGNGAKQ